MAVIHLFQPDSLELRGYLAMFQSTTLRGQAGLVWFKHILLITRHDKRIGQSEKLCLALSVSWLISITDWAGLMVVATASITIVICCSLKGAMLMAVLSIVN